MENEEKTTTARSRRDRAAVAATTAANKRGAAATRSGNGSPGDETSETQRADERLREDARQAAEGLKEAAREQAREVKETVSETAESVIETADRKADSWSSDLGERTQSLARALRSASGTLRAEGQTEISGMTESAADQIERMAGYLVDEDPRGMLDDLEDTARSNPTWFLGATFALGLLGGRLLRASSPTPGHARDDDGPDGSGRRFDRREGPGRMTDSGTWVGEPGLTPRTPLETRDE